MATNAMARQQLELLWQSIIMDTQGSILNGFSFRLQQLADFGEGGLRELMNRYRYFLRYNRVCPC